MWQRGNCQYFLKVLDCWYMLKTDLAFVFNMVDISRSNRFKTSGMWLDSQAL